MQSTARHSPKTRGIADLEVRMERLEAYEAWGKPIRINYNELAGEEGWSLHLSHLDQVLELLKRAEVHASDLRSRAVAFAGAPRSKPRALSSASQEDA